MYEILFVDTLIHKGSCSAEFEALKTNLALSDLVLFHLNK